jgi:hypothetical protein
MQTYAPWEPRVARRNHQLAHREPLYRLLLATGKILRMIRGQSERAAVVAMDSTRRYLQIA